MPETQANPTSIWSPGPHGARLRVGALQGCVDPLHPDSGLNELLIDGDSTPGWLFGAKPPAGPFGPLVESYARGADLISSYTATESFPFYTTLGWSGAATAEGVRVTLTVSLRTDLLDTNPDLPLVSDLGQTPQHGPDGLWTLAQDQGRTIAAVPHPTDAVDAHVEIGASRCVVKLSPPFLEKGVIRCCRVAAFVLPAGANEEALVSALARFADAPPPLTA